MNGKMIVVVGGTVDQARKYCQRNGLGLGEAVVAHDYKSFSNRPYYEGAVIRFVGTFHSRMDADEVFNDFAARRYDIEDMTEPEESHE